MKLKIVNSILVLLSIYSFGQNQKSNTNLIPILPKWEINDVHTLKIKFSQKEVMEEKSTKWNINFNASFKVLEKNEKGYLLVWTFNSAQVTEGKPNSEDIIISKLLNNEILIKFSNFGEYVEIVNVDAVRLAANKIIDNLIAKETHPKEKLNLNVKKQLIATKEGLESTLLRVVKMYFLPFGHQYPLNEEMTYNLKYPNLFGGNQPYDSVEKVRLTMTDNTSNICVIEANEIIDTRQLLKDYNFFLKNKLNYKDKDIENVIRKYKVEIKQNLTHHVDLKKGYLVKLTLKRVADLGILTTTNSYEVEIVN